MEEQIFNANDMKWVNTDHGLTKVLLGDQFSKTSRFRIFCLEAGKHFETHEHEFTQCMYFTSGQGEVSVDDRVEKIVPGLTVIVLPKQCHTITNTGDTAIEIIVVEIMENTPQDTPFVDF